MLFSSQHISAMLKDNLYLVQMTTSNPDVIILQTQHCRAVSWKLVENGLGSHHYIKLQLYVKSMRHKQVNSSWSNNKGCLNESHNK